MELTTSWKEERGEEGRAEALKEAREHECQLILRLLRKRFGALDPELETRIGKYYVAQLEDLAEAWLDFTSLVQLRDWLLAR